MWHDGDAARIVLIADLWHPEVDLPTMVHPLLSSSQRADLDAAMANAHTPLGERGYSTGETVSRKQP